jgi:hypothetical protein
MSQIIPNYDRSILLKNLLIFFGGVSIGAVAVLWVMKFSGDRQTANIIGASKTVDRSIGQVTQSTPSAEAENAASLAFVSPTQTQVEPPKKDNQTSLAPALENPGNNINSNIALKSTPQEPGNNLPTQTSSVIPSNESTQPAQIAKRNIQPESELSSRNLQARSNDTYIANPAIINRTLEEIKEIIKVTPIQIENKAAVVTKPEPTIKKTPRGKEEYSSPVRQDLITKPNITRENQRYNQPLENITGSSSLTARIENNLPAETAISGNEFGDRERAVTLAESESINREPRNTQRDSSTSEPSIIAQSDLPPVPITVPTVPNVREPEQPPATQQSNVTVRPAQLFFQGVYIQQNENASLRGRIAFNYAVTPNFLFGTTIDAVRGDAFINNYEGFNINELYVAFSPSRLPNLRFVIGQLDLTSYFDRNSFAKDATTHFFNQIFQTNPALSRSGVDSRPAMLMNWAINDNIEAKAAVFSSNPDLKDFALNGFAGELGFRWENFIVRGTYVASQDRGQNDGFREIFQIDRGGGRFGLLANDAEVAYGVNAEWYIPQIKMGLFGRFGRYENQTLGLGGNTFNAGINLFDIFRRDDRFGVGYGRDLSNNNLRREVGEKVPDVLEVFYDLPVLPHLRMGFTFQGVDSFSEAIVGFRIKTQFNWTPFERR